MHSETPWSTHPPELRGGSFPQVAPAQQAPGSESTTSSAPPSPEASSTTSTAPGAPGEETTTTTVAQGAPTSSTTVPDTTATTSTTTEPVETTTTTVAVTPRAAVPPAVRSTEIAAGSVWLALAVAVVVPALVWFALRRRRDGDQQAASTPTDTGRAVPGDVSATAVEEGVERTGAASSPPDAVATLHFLVELGRALLDAGENVMNAEQTLVDVAEANGIDGLGALVLPTAIIISVPGDATVSTEVRTAGVSKLRMDQADEILELADRARRGELSPDEGLTAIEQARARGPRVAPALRLVGVTAYTIGLVLLMRGGWVDLVVAGLLGLGTGALQMAVARGGPKLAQYQSFWPLLSAFAVSVVVLSLGRVVDDLTVFAAILAPLVTFLPGGMLTTGVVELSTGQILSGAGRLASGLLQLVLLALGILAGAQLVGVPATSLGSSTSHQGAPLVAWIGVAVFGVGYYLYFGARKGALPWIILVLYVAYAGQVLGGLFFGGVMSAFFGAAAMTPVAMLASRLSSGPSMLVSFMPGFWLLVPGALGLEGVTRIFGGDGTAGSTAMATTVATMVAVSMGVLFGLAVGNRIPSLATAASVRTVAAGLRRPLDGLPLHRSSSEPGSEDVGRRRRRAD